MINNYNNPTPTNFREGYRPASSIVDAMVLPLIKDGRIGSLFKSVPINASQLGGGFFGGYDPKTFGTARFFFNKYGYVQRHNDKFFNLPMSMMGVVQMLPGEELPINSIKLSGDKKPIYMVPSPEQLADTRIVTMNITKRIYARLKLNINDYQYLLKYKTIEAAKVASIPDTINFRLDAEIMALMTIAAYCGGEEGRFMNVGKENNPNFKFITAENPKHVFNTFLAKANGVLGLNTLKKFNDFLEKVKLDVNKPNLDFFVKSKKIRMNPANLEFDVKAGKVKTKRGLGYLVIPQLHNLGEHESNQYEDVVNYTNGNIIRVGLSSVQSQIIRVINSFQQTFNDEIMGMSKKDLGIITNIYINNKFIKGGAGKFGDGRYGEEKQDNYGGIFGGIKYTENVMIGKDFDSNLYVKDSKFYFKNLGMLIYHNQAAAFLITDIRTSSKPDFENVYQSFITSVYYDYCLLRPYLIKAIFTDEPEGDAVKYNSITIIDKDGKEETITGDVHNNDRVFKQDVIEQPSAKKKG